MRNQVPPTRMKIAYLDFLWGVVMNTYSVKAGVLVLAIFMTSAAIAQGGWQRSGDGYVGTGANTGSGYQPTDNGYAGTGNATGGGWSRTDSGYVGTGRNTGGGYIVNDQQMIGSGNNAGGGWAKTGNGVCVGTGSNAGRSFQSPGC